MKKLLLLIFLLLPVLAFSQVNSVRYLTADSLPLELPQWKFQNGDHIEWASDSIDDRQWPQIQTQLLVNKNGITPFNGKAWFRIHITIDSSLVNQPVAFCITQYGASRLYVDGELKEVFGGFTPGKPVEYFDPHGAPFAIVFKSPGRHLLALQYINLDYNIDVHRYSVAGAGFTATLDNSDNAVMDIYGQPMILIGLTMCLFGIFIALALAHLILFLFYRAEKSNLLFSNFSGCIAFMFLMPAIVSFTGSPATELHAVYAGYFISLAACCSLSALINGLFGRKNWRHYTILSLGLLGVLLLIILPHVGRTLMVTLTILSALEAVIVTATAMVKKVPGARILGAGILFFMLSFLAILLIGMSRGGFIIDPETTTGILMELIIGLAILSVPVSMSAYLAWKFSYANRELKTQLAQVQLLSEQNLAQEKEKQHLLENQKENLEREVTLRTAEVQRQKDEIELQHDALKVEKKKSDDLLLNILPEEVAEELKETGKSEARLYTDVSVLFTDFVDFTQRSEELRPSELVAEIDHCFRAFDHIIEAHQLEKIKTVGDAYIAVSGLPVENKLHAQMVVAAGIEIRDFMLQRVTENPRAFGIRLGIHSGPVVAGIVGVKKFAYDIWGDTVNTAARMEQHSEACKVNISDATYALVKNDFACIYRGRIEAKHKGKMEMYFVNNR